MQTLLPSLPEALTVHEEAHRHQSGALHAVALKLLALAGQQHIATDDLDPAEDATPLDDLPGVVCVKGEAAALVAVPGKGKQAPSLASDDSAMLQALRAAMPRGALTEDAHFKRGRRLPAYGLYLVRVAEAKAVAPQSSLRVGRHVPVGWPRKQGAYKFPVAAQKLEGEYQFLQVHKDGEQVRVFAKDGSEPDGLAEVVDAFVALDKPHSCIVECVLDEAGLKVLDALQVDGADLTQLPFDERFTHLAKVGSRDVAWADIGVESVVHTLRDQEALYGLPPGRWLIRHQHETYDDFLRPYHFIHETGTAKIGTVLPWLQPAPAAQDTSGMIRVPLTGLPPLQIHKGMRGVRIYMSPGGRDHAEALPQIVAAAKQLPEHCIIEAMWTCQENGLMVSAGRVQNLQANLSACDVRLYPYDLLWWGDEDLSGEPMYERVEMLERILPQLGDLATLGVADDGTPAWVFVADSSRPLNGACDHCFLDPA